jgi:septal ring factor EnvC (AmiA/AmiB activator)
MNDENQNESIQRLSERLKNMSDRVSECESEFRSLMDHRATAEARLKIFESELKGIDKEISDMGSRLKVLELNHNDRRERWNSVANFVAQLVWVAMAAFLLTKLGLQAPL